MYVAKPKAPAAMRSTVSAELGRWSHHAFTAQRSIRSAVSEPADACEREADEMADQAMRVATPTSAGPIASAGSTPSNGHGGEPLSRAMRDVFEPRFGHDFGQVRIHSDTNAANAAKAVNARAFTVGSDIVFAAGERRFDTHGGQRLLAHELTHVAQQGGSTPQRGMAGVLPAVRNHIGLGQQLQRTIDDASVEADLNAWATKNGVKLNKDSQDYPHDLWTFVASLIQDQAAGYGPVPKPPASDKAKLAEWTANFEKAEIVAKWLIALRTSGKTDTIRSAADSRAHGILDYMIQAGMVTKALAQAPGLSDSSQASLHKTILDNPTSATAAELGTIVAKQAAASKDPKSVAIVQKLTDHNVNTLKSLDAARTKAILKALIDAYGDNDTIIDAIVEVLLLNPKVRTDVSDAMMAKTLGTPEILFKVLKHKYFVEPDYGGATMAAAKPDGMSDDDYQKKRMKDDMPWVYTYKQKYYVDFLIALAKSQKITIAPPKSMTTANLRTWLETNTGNIADAAKAKHANDPQAIIEIYKNIADIFFFHIPHDRNVVPDLAGKISHLVPGDPDKKRFEADCDVFATYAMRLLTQAGFEPIGYIAYVPHGKDSARSAHVAAVVRKDGTYHVINNKGVLPTGISETTKDAEKIKALKAARKAGFDDAYGDPRPTEVKIFYDDAGTKGEMTQKFNTQDGTLERTDLN